MNRYRVVVTPEAEAQIRESFRYIYGRSPVNAERWFRQLYAEIEGLELHPERYAFAKERDYLEENLRQFVFKSHRVVFHVNKASGTICVLHVRHSARLAVGEPWEAANEFSED